MAGNGTIGLEILEDLPDVNTVLVPFGGGGLACGIATAVRGLRSEVRVYGCEVDTAAPLAAALTAGGPVPCARTATFVDGIGGPALLPARWRPPSATWSSTPRSSPKGPAARRWQLRSRASPDQVAMSRSSRAETSTRRF